MSIGASGRIVLEVDPALKRRLYAILTIEGLTLKDWFQYNANLYISNNAINFGDQENISHLQKEASKSGEEKK